MHMCRRSSVFTLPLKPLAAGLGAMFALAAVPASSTPDLVSNCLDSGSGSLRAAVTGAAPGDTVDMTTLSCSLITLTSGEIVVSQAKLTLQGPGVGKLVIDGNRNGRVLNHQGTDLYVYDLSIANGYVYSLSGVAAGGCIYSHAQISLTRVSVSGCTAQTYSGAARGGGIFSGGLILSGSTMSSNTTGCYAGGTATGGGAMIEATFSTASSSIDHNSATCRAGGTASSGGVYLRGGGQITDSTISNNTSSGDFGGISARPFSFFKTLGVSNSTISGNVAGGFVGGMYSSEQTSIANSTIAFNTAGAGSPSAGVYKSPGLHIDYAGASQGSLRSCLIANNTYGATGRENDFSLAGTALSDLSSASNLIRQTTASVPGNISGACPLLGPLRDNGGATLTHALLSHSPGIDAGDSGGLTFDQRGTPYARASGLSADIGAYEVQQSDIVFDAGFDGCPAL